VSVLRPKFDHQSRRNAGFTRMELLLLVVFIGISAAIVVPRRPCRAKEARKAAAEQQLASFRSALDLFKMEVGYYPSTEQGLLALLVNPESTAEPRKWKGPYLETWGGEIPIDPWGEPFHYACPGLGNPREYDLSSSTLDAWAATTGGPLQGLPLRDWRTILGLGLLALDLGAMPYLCLPRNIARVRALWLTLVAVLGSALGIVLTGISYGYDGAEARGFPFVDVDGDFWMLNFLVGLGIPFIALAVSVIWKGKHPLIS